MAVVEIRFFLDPETGEPHILEHGVTEEEVEEVLLRPAEDLRPGATPAALSGRPAPAATRA
jgi:hypothetical protein